MSSLSRCKQDIIDTDNIMDAVRELGNCLLIERSCFLSARGFTIVQGYLTPGAMPVGYGCLGVYKMQSDIDLMQARSPKAGEREPSVDSARVT
jgi:hypothetical protein